MLFHYKYRYGVDVTDFGKGWRNGLAFLALIKSINPDLVDLRASLSREPKENVQQAFIIAHQSLDVPPLLEPEGKSFCNGVSALNSFSFLHRDECLSVRHHLPRC